MPASHGRRICDRYFHGGRESFDVQPRLLLAQCPVTLTHTSRQAVPRLPWTTAQEYDVNRQDHPLVSLAILKARPGSGTENGLAGLDREPGNRNILSPGWAYEETSKATKLEVGELDIGKIQDVPGILKLYIKWGYEERPSGYQSNQSLTMLMNICDIAPGLTVKAVSNDVALLFSSDTQ